MHSGNAFFLHSFIVSFACDLFLGSCDCTSDLFSESICVCDANNTCACEESWSTFAYIFYIIAPTVGGIFVLLCGCTIFPCCPIARGLKGYDHRTAHGFHDDDDDFHGAMKADRYDHNMSTDAFKSFDKNRHPPVPVIETVDQQTGKVIVTQFYLNHGPYRN